MRLRASILAAALLAAGCGGGGSKEPGGQGTGTLGALLARPGPDAALIQGTSDYAAGPVRVSFLIVRNNGQLVSRPRARVWVGPSLDAPPTLTTEAALAPVGVPGASAAAVGEVKDIYVAHFRLPKPGKYTIVVEPAGGGIQGFADLLVAGRPKAPAVGEKAIPSRTPTLAGTHGNVAALTTRKPPDLALVRHSVAGSLAAHKPFVLVFATPKFCTSRTCGPVVDVVDAVRKRFAKTDIRFIHVEIYKDNDPSLGENRWVKEWRLPTEPFTFLVGRDGRIKARFEGSVSVAELAAAVRRHLP